MGDTREGLAFLWRQRLVCTTTLVGFGNRCRAGGVVRSRGQPYLRREGTTAT